MADTNLTLTPPTATWDAVAALKAERATLEAFIARIAASNCLYLSAFVNQATALLAAAAADDAST